MTPEDSGATAVDAAALIERVLPAADAADLLVRLADAIGQPVAIARELTQTHIVAHPGVGVVDAAPPADIILANPAAERLRLHAHALDEHALSEKLEAMAELAAGAGHEVNNPLATIAGRAKLLLKGETDSGRRRSLAQIAAEAYRGRDMIGDLMLFARPPQPVIEPVRVIDVFEEVRTEFADDLAEASLRIAGDRNQTATVAADRTQLAIVLSELLRNAIRFADSTITVTIEPVTIGEQSFVRIATQDDGPGLDATSRAHLFDPFFSGRQAGRGLGFGLTKCWRIVHQHGGRIACEERPLRLVIAWPAAG